MSPHRGGESPTSTFKGRRLKQEEVFRSGTGSRGGGGRGGIVQPKDRMIGATINFLAIQTFRRKLLGKSKSTQQENNRQVGRESHPWRLSIGSITVLSPTTGREANTAPVLPLAAMIYFASGDSRYPAARYGQWDAGVWEKERTGCWGNKKREEGGNDPISRCNCSSMELEEGEGSVNRQKWRERVKCRGRHRALLVRTRTPNKERGGARPRYFITVECPDLPPFSSAGLDREGG